jgi:uncharacterized protein involved in response to NO
MPALAWIAFAGVQLTAVLRIVGEIGPAWINQLAIAVWLLAMVPWLVRYAGIVCLPRADGKPG